jgi:lipoprotein-anchoring transpeptidase ErfK/SrfK
MQRAIFIFQLAGVVMVALTSAGQASSTTEPAAQSPAVQPARPQAASQLDAPASDPRLGTLDARARRGLATQVALDRAGFSPGELDAAPGGNTTRALRAFQQSAGLPATGELDAKTVAQLGDPFANPVAGYAISAEDAAGPFVPKIPTDMMEKSKLPALGYASVLELLAERFHSSPKLLQRLNPQAKFASGEMIIVPNVEPFLGAASKTARAATAAKSDPAPASGSAAAAKPDAAAAGSTAKPATPANTKPATTSNAKPATTGNAKPATTGNVVTVTERNKSLVVQNAAGETVFHAPVTVGSENDPLPVGEWKVNGVSHNPTFNYNPDLFWDANPTHAKAKIPAGPNNPVGVVWIDLSKEHYGIHGTPEPSRVGYTESHGCIRLTNWDAARLAALVGPGTKVILR